MSVAARTWVPLMVPTTAFFPALPLTTYNTITTCEAQAASRLIRFLKRSPGSDRMEQVLWAASGSEAIHKAIWASLNFDRSRPLILATRFGFHGKKGFSFAVTGSEADPERDPRVKFITFPRSECADVTQRETPFDATPYRHELESLRDQLGQRIGTLITEPYLGGGGSYHPPKAYLQVLQQFCRENGITFILDEVQANFGRTGSMFAFETYGLEPDLVVLGKGLGNGVPVAAVAGRKDILGSLDFGEASDTWSANPLSNAAVIATLDEYESRDILGPMRTVSAQIEAGLVALKAFPFVAAVRGERGGMVWGIEMADHGGRTAAEWAAEFVLAAYRGDGSPDGDGVHLLGPLAKKVIRISPPLIITEEEAAAANAILHAAARRLATSDDALKRDFESDTMSP
jgi:4-aminobutyrate aminotransferase-like enzyme